MPSCSTDWGTRAGTRAPALGRKESKGIETTWQQVIVPDLQRQREASTKPVVYRELATWHSSGQEDYWMHTGSSQLLGHVCLSSPQRTEGLGPAWSQVRSDKNLFDFLEPFWTVRECNRVLLQKCQELIPVCSYTSDPICLYQFPRFQDSGPAYGFIPLSSHCSSAPPPGKGI